MFVDYLTVMMVAVLAAAALTIAYGLMFVEAPLADQKPWGWAFGIVGLLLGATGLHMVLAAPRCLQHRDGRACLVLRVGAPGHGIRHKGWGESDAARGARPLRGRCEHLLEHRHVGTRSHTQPSALGPRLRSYRLGCDTLTPGRTQGEGVALGADGGGRATGHWGSDLRPGWLRRISGAYVYRCRLRQVGASGNETGSIRYRWPWISSSDGRIPSQR